MHNYVRKMNGLLTGKMETDVYIIGHSRSAYDSRVLN